MFVCIIVLWSIEIKADIASKKVIAVGDVRQRMPKIGGLKLYHILKEPLQKLGVGKR
jgi:hypothetical protein